MYAFLNVFFLVFHAGVVLFDALGWMWKRTRLLHLGAVLLTALSWGVLGIWRGFGYCILTDWHWRVRRKLGYRDMPDSYIKFLLDEITGLDLSETLVTRGVYAGFLTALLASVGLNIRDRWGSSTGR